MIGRKLGVNTSIQGGLYKSAIRAKELGTTVYQIFTRSSRSWKFKECTDEIADKFSKTTQELGYNQVVSHLPYLPNFAALEKEMIVKTQESLQEEVKRCKKLGIKDIVLHIGSHKGKGMKKGQRQVINHFEKIISDELDIRIALETGAGTKNSVGSKFEDIANILDGLSDKSQFGICFDTCHVFAAGYDFRTEDGTDQVIQNLDDQIGVQNIYVFHANDSKVDLGGGADRHDHIGLGYIGTEGFTNLFTHPKIRNKNVPIICETPINDSRDDIGNMAELKRLITI